MASSSRPTSAMSTSTTSSDMKKKKSPYRRRQARIPAWWMQLTPHFTLDLEDEDAKREAEVLMALYYAQLAEESLKDGMMLDIDGNPIPPEEVGDDDAGGGGWGGRQNKDGASGANGANGTKKPKAFGGRNFRPGSEGWDPKQWGIDANDPNYEFYVTGQLLPRQYVAAMNNYAAATGQQQQFDTLNTLKSGDDKYGEQKKSFEPVFAHVKLRGTTKGEASRNGQYDDSANKHLHPRDEFEDEEEHAYVAPPKRLVIAEEEALLKQQAEAPPSPPCPEKRWAPPPKPKGHDADHRLSAPTPESEPSAKLNPFAHVHHSPTPSQSSSHHAPATASADPQGALAPPPPFIDSTERTEEGKVQEAMPEQNSDGKVKEATAVDDEVMEGDATSVDDDMVNEVELAISADSAAREHFETGEEDAQQQEQPEVEQDSSKDREQVTATPVPQNHPEGRKQSREQAAPAHTMQHTVKEPSFVERESHPEAAAAASTGRETPANTTRDFVVSPQPPVVVEMTEEEKEETKKRETIALYYSTLAEKDEAAGIMCDVAGNLIKLDRKTTEDESDSQGEVVELPPQQRGRWRSLSRGPTNNNKESRSRWGRSFSRNRKGKRDPSEERGRTGGGFGLFGILRRCKHAPEPQQRKMFQGLNYQPGSLGWDPRPWGIPRDHPEFQAYQKGEKLPPKYVEAMHNYAKNTNQTVDYETAVAAQQQQQQQDDYLQFNPNGFGSTVNFAGDDDETKECAPGYKSRELPDFGDEGDAKNGGPEDDESLVDPSKDLIAEPALENWKPGDAARYAAESLENDTPLEDGEIKASDAENKNQEEAVTGGEEHDHVAEEEHNQGGEEHSHHEVTKENVEENMEEQTDRERTENGPEEESKSETEKEAGKQDPPEAGSNEAEDAADSAPKPEIKKSVPAPPRQWPPVPKDDEHPEAAGTAQNSDSVPKELEAVTTSKPVFQKPKSSVAAPPRQWPPVPKDAPAGTTQNSESVPEESEAGTTPKPVFQKPKTADGAAPRQWPPPAKDAAAGTTQNSESVPEESEAGTTPKPVFQKPKTAVGAPPRQWPPPWRGGKTEVANTAPNSAPRPIVQKQVSGRQWPPAPKESNASDSQQPEAASTEKTLNMDYYKKKAEVQKERVHALKESELQNEEDQQKTEDATLKSDPPGVATKPVTDAEPMASLRSVSKKKPSWIKPASSAQAQSDKPQVSEAEPNTVEQPSSLKPEAEAPVSETPAAAPMEPIAEAKPITSLGKKSWMKPTSSASAQNEKPKVSASAVPGRARPPPSEQDKRPVTPQGEDDSVVVFNAPGPQGRAFPPPKNSVGQSNKGHDDESPPGQGQKQKEATEDDSIVVFNAPNAPGPRGRAWPPKNSGDQSDVGRGDDSSIPYVLRPPPKQQQATPAARNIRDDDSIPLVPTQDTKAPPPQRRTSRVAPAKVDDDDDDEEPLLVFSAPGAQGWSSSHEVNHHDDHSYVEEVVEEVEEIYEEVEDSEYEEGEEYEIIEVNEDEYESFAEETEHEEIIEVDPAYKKSALPPLPAGVVG